MGAQPRCGATPPSKTRYAPRWPPLAAPLAEEAEAQDPGGGSPSSTRSSISLSGIETSDPS
eukprot:3438527-Pyramimonas_sp.AAC.1